MDASSHFSTLQLRDGRQLAYNIFPKLGFDGLATTLLYFHGFPGSRIEADLLTDYAQRRSIQIIAPDRPGSGESTFQPNRTFKDWAQDVEDLVDHLNIHDFFILGVSGGSPYVFSCLEHFPSSRIRGVAIVSGVYPTSLNSPGMPLSAKALFWIAASSWFSFLAAPLLEWDLGRPSRDTSNADQFEEQFMKTMASKHPNDVKCLEDESIRAAAIGSLREAFKYGSQGQAEEAKLYGQAWKIHLEGRDLSRVHIWHGQQDLNVPYTSAIDTATALPEVTLHLQEDESHLSLPVNCQDEILDCLLSS